MTSVLAWVRPDSWNLPLFVHVLGAMILVGAMLTSASLLATARGDARLLRLGYWTLLVVGLPSYVLMWGGAHWIYSREGLDEGAIELTWIAIGFAVAEAGAVLFVAALIVGAIGMRRLRNDGGGGLLKATTVLTLVLLAAFVVAIWAMAGKPDQRSRCTRGRGRRPALPAGRPCTAECIRRQGRGARGGNRRFHPRHNDHGLHTREPAIGRQIQGSPLALRRALQRASWNFRRLTSSASGARDEL